jgi:hypothetical protein
MADNIINFNLSDHVSIVKLMDPLSLDQQSKYRTLGLTYTSNNENIIPRDTAGNIMMQEGSDTNPLLIIDAVSEQITTKSALRVLDTAFQYFKFPVSVNVTTGSADLNLDLNLDQDIIYARYKPSEDRKIAVGFIDPTYPHTGSSFSGILMDTVEEGLPQKNTNAYYITKEIKNSGKDLRIRITLQHRYDSYVEDEISNVLFSLIKTNVNTGINRSYRVYPEDTLIISQYQVKTLVIDDIIFNEQFDIGDTFSLGAVCSISEEFKYHTINAVTSYWVTTDASKRVDEWNQELPPLPPVETEATTNQSEMPRETI